MINGMSKNTSEIFLRETRLAFENQINPVKAQKMKAYMRNQFEYIGMNSELRKIIQRKIIQKLGVPEVEQLEVVVRELWKLPEREYQYFAIELLKSRIKKVPADIIKLLEDIILTKSWWDTIDFISPSLVGVIFKHYPELIIPVTDRWMDSENIWLQRSCILFQLKYKEDMNLELLYKFIDRLKDSKEFFIKKSIGWILRQYSKFNPAEVRRFVESTDLQALSIREAMKYVKQKE